MNVTNLRLSAVVFLVCITGSAHSQSRSQLRLKLGAHKVLLTPGNSEGYAYKLSSPSNPYLAIGLEFNKPIRESAVSWFSGISLEPQGVKISMNHENFQTVAADPTVSHDESTFRFYAGFGKTLNGISKKSRLVVFGGLGLAVNFESSGSGSGNLSASEGVTRDGEQFISPYKNWFILPGYQMWVYVDREFRVSPTLFSGIRWQLVTQKGHDGVGVEFLSNYGLSPYFEYVVPYTLDGIEHEDRFRENGFCFQLNLLLPVWKFGKKNNSK